MTTISGDMPAAAPASREERDHFRVLYESALVFGASHELDAVLALVCGQVQSALRADLAVIWMDGGDGLRCRASAGPVGGPAVGDMPVDADPDDVRAAEEGPDAGRLREQLASSGRVFGMLEVVAGTAREPFTAGDRALMRDLAPLAAASLADAEARHADSRAADLTLLLEISREITATLDLDRVLRSVVNLSARALSFDRAAVALYDKGICDIRAVAGQQTINPKDPKILDLAARAAWVAGHGESFYMVDREDPASDAERQMVQIFGQDLEADDARSGLYLPLKDEEGTVGILLFEASRPEFATPMQREIAAILANQTAVALRNAQLYAQVPLVDTLGALAAKKRAFMELPRRQRQAYAALAVGALAALTLIRWPLRVSGTNPTFRPLALTEVRALVPGVVERVLIHEGSAVVRGAPLAQLRDVDMRSARIVAVAAVAAADRAASLAASHGDAAEERAQRMRGETLRAEAALLDEQLAAATIRASAPGIVLTARPEERIGAHLVAGDLVATIGRTDSLELEFGIDQRDIGRVAVGSEVRLRVDALPQRTFVGRVTSLGPLPTDSSERVSFPVRAAVANPEALLRPGMAAYARVLTAPASVAARMFRAPARWARLLWWRMWA